MYLTGVSGGGIPGHMMCFNHPDLLAAAALSCPNFRDQEYRRLAGRFDRRTTSIPIRQFLGGRDPIGWRYRRSLFGAMVATCVWLVVWRRWNRSRWSWILGSVAFVGVLLLFMATDVEAQANAALRLFRDLGYSDVKQITIPEMGHEPAHLSVVRTFDVYWGTR